MEDERNRKFWNTIFNHGVEVKYRPAHDKGIARYSLTKGLLVDQMEVVENAKFAKARMALKVWLSWIAAALQLEDSAMEVVCLPRTEGRYLLSGFDCPSQAGHRLRAREDKEPGLPYAGSW